MITLKKYQKLLAQGDKAKLTIKQAKSFDEVSKTVFKFKTVSDLTVLQIVDCENYIKNADFVSFCRIFVVKKWYQTIKYNDLHSILLNFSDQKQVMFENYPYA